MSAALILAGVVAFVALCALLALIMDRQMSKWEL